MSKEYVIGIDVGGTHTRIGKINAKGEVLKNRMLKTAEYGDGATFLEDMIECEPIPPLELEPLLEEEPLLVASISCAIILKSAASDPVPSFLDVFMVIPFKDGVSYCTLI